MREAGTNPEPTLQTTALVTTGPYQWSQHPMYLSATLQLFGLAVIFNSRWLLAFLLPWLLWLEMVVVSSEQESMASLFGDKYTEWAASTGRWFPLCLQMPILTPLLELLVVGFLVVFDAYLAWSILHRQKSALTKTVVGQRETQSGTQSKSAACVLM